MTMLVGDPLWSISDVSQKRTLYKVTKIQKSESAFVFFAEQEGGERQEVVLKVLRKYADKRYHLTTIKERHTCQCEALSRNEKANPGVYKGLAPIFEPDLATLEKLIQLNQLQYITLGSEEHVRKSEELQDQSVDYALVMARLPEKQRLDCLLYDCQRAKQMEPLLCCLVEKVASMHDRAIRLSTLPREKTEWGSYKQLKKKLEHNIAHFDHIKELDAPLYQEYRWIEYALREFMKKPQLQKAFQLRRNTYIKQCHGDLKTRNIWLGEIKNNGHSVQVNILDAIDFNTIYCNIDVLSDVAMLAIDIRSVSMHSYGDRVHYKRKLAKQLANYVTKKYLSITGQQDTSAKIALKFYLIEKAIVLAIMNLIYDRAEYRHFGRYCLEIAVEYMEELDKQLGTTIVKDYGPESANGWFNKFLVELIAKTTDFVAICNSLPRFRWKRI